MLKINLAKGKYVVAVSGGVDSMVLLDLVRQSDSELLVAHFVHGIRNEAETAEDLRVIEEYCNRHDLRLVIGHNEALGTSEAQLREARYLFLDQQKTKNDYNAVITAHHNDDVLETAVINMLRGTNSAGIVSLRSTDAIIRPLLGFDKQEIVEYANDHELQWNEDSTNDGDDYLRNYVRHNIVEKLNKAELRKIIEKQLPLETEIEDMVTEFNNAKLLRYGDRIEMMRADFVQLPHDVALRVARSFFDEADLGTPPSKQMIEQMVVTIKTGANASGLDISKSARLEINDTMFVIRNR